MDKNVNPKRVHTAPIKLRTEVDPKASLIRELEGYEPRIEAARRTVRHKRAEGHLPLYAAEAKGTVDVPATVASVIADMGHEVDLDKIYLAQYIVRKMLPAARAGVIDERIDGELAQLRRLMRTSLFKP